MFYGIEQSTDMRDKRTVIKKFNTKPALLKWLQHCVGFTYDDPDAARNHHHSFRSGYELMGRIDKKDKVFTYHGTPTYPCTSKDQLVNYIQKYGQEVEA
jgi:hypothetical protein